MLYPTIGMNSHSAGTAGFMWFSGLTICGHNN